MSLRNALVRPDERPRPRRPLLLALAVGAVATLGASAPAAGPPKPSEPPGIAAADLEALQRAFDQVVQRVSPSVVGIRAWRRGPADGRTGDGARILVNGSGTVVAPGGLILTNEHVVQGASEIEVLCFDGQKLRGTVFAADPRSDLAVLHIARRDLPVATFCDWSQVARGHWTIALGNPFGLAGDGSLSVSVGVVANLDRSLPGLGEVDDRFYHDMIQTTAPINPGNSGGPLFNIRGELIGVVTAMHTRAPSDEGIGFAIPMSPARRRIIDQLLQGRSIQYGYLGASVRSVAAEGEHGPPADRGVIVDQVDPHGPAARAGVRVGDVLVRFDDQPVRSPGHLAELVGRTEVGRLVTLTLLRDREARTVLATIDARDVSRVSWMRSGAVLWRGLRLVDLSPDVRRLLRVGEDTRGIAVIDVLPRSPGAQAGIQIGQVIEAVGGEKIDGVADLLARVRDARREVVVSVRGHGARTVAP